MKTGEAERWLQQQLETIYEEGERKIIAAWVFEKLTGRSRQQRLQQQTESLPVEQLHALTAITQRLRLHEPVQYVLNEAYFHGLKLYVDNTVLIPRPETEELVSWIIEDVKAADPGVFDAARDVADQTRSLKILDVGTGSGAIALALKKAAPKAEVWGCDISGEALNIARRNGAALDIRVDFQQVNILAADEWRSLPLFDVIVSNPPYIAAYEQKKMAANVVAHEPHLALFVPDDDPLVFYKTLAGFAFEKLHSGGALYVEIHEDRGHDVIQLFQTPMFKQVVLKKDMQGKDRMVKALVF